jgi:tetratricopeptide (TPR) repeat protein
MRASLRTFEGRVGGALKLIRRCIAPLLGLVVFSMFLPTRATPQTVKDTKPADYSTEPFVIEQLLSKVAFQNDGTSSSEVTVRARVQSQAGVQQFGVLNLPYASATSTLEVVYVRVIKPDKSIVKTPAENGLDMPADITRQAPFYSDLKEEQIAVKGLEIGDTVEYQFRENVTKPIDPGQFWDSFNFEEDGIVLDEELQISVPRDKYVNVKSAKLQPTITVQGAVKIYDWKTANLEHKPTNKTTMPQVSDDSQIASVQLTTFRSWDEVGQWFHGLAAPQAVPTPEIQAKAKELTQGAQTDTAKIQALYNFVSTKYRYIGISLGIGRYQPHSAADVLSNDYGDCKDKHTLFAALLAASGVKAFPALMNSSVTIDPDVPSPGQFDHVITALPDGKGFTFLDTTPEIAPFGMLIATLRDKKALVIPDSGTAQMVQTPADPPFKAYFTFQADGRLDDTGTLASKMQMTFRGDEELLYRVILRQAGQPKWNDVMQNVSSNLGFGGTVSEVTASAPDATDVPFHIQYSYLRKSYSDWDNRRMTPPFPGFDIPDLSDDVGKNPKPIKLGSPEEYRYIATITLPTKSNPDLLPAVNLNEDFAEYHSTYSVSDGVMHVERRLITKTHEVAPGQFEAYRKFIKAIVNDTTTYIPLFGESNEFSGTPEAQAMFQQGQEASRLHDLPTAAEAFQRAVDKDPKFAAAWLALGYVDYSLGKRDQGVQEMKKSIAADPSRVATYKYVGPFLMAQNRKAEALEVWQGLEKISPQDPDAPRNIASILMQEFLFPQAVTELEAAVKTNPNDAGLTLQLGDAYAHTGNKEKAVPMIEKAAEMDHGSMSLNNAAYALADNDLDLDNALRYGQGAVKQTETATSQISLDAISLQDIRLMPSLASFWDTLGWVHFWMGHFELAEQYLNAGWNLTQSAVIGDHLGQVYEKEGKKKEAAIAYSLALSAGHAPAETQSRLDTLGFAGKYQPGAVNNTATLQDMRSTQLGRLATKHATAEFFVLFAPESKIVDVKFISGSEELRTADKALRAAKFDVPFPEGSSAQIVRRGILDCEPELSGCLFVVIAPTSVDSAN